MSGQKGMRETRQRVMILDELRRTKTHPTADELHQVVRRRLPRVSLGTVYRNLELLSKLGLIQKLEIAGGQMRFDGDTREHCHVRCTDCGRVDDVEGKCPEHFEQAFVDRNGYKIIGHRLELIGVCPQCQGDR